MKILTITDRPYHSEYRYNNNIRLVKFLILPNWTLLEHHNTTYDNTLRSSVYGNFMILILSCNRYVINFRRKS